MRDVLVFYLLSVVLFAIGGAALSLFFKKRNIKPRLTFVFLGILFAVVYFVVLFVLFFSTFNVNSDQYFYTKTYTIGIGLAYIFILSINIFCPLHFSGIVALLSYYKTDGCTLEAECCSEAVLNVSLV